MIGDGFPRQARVLFALQAKSVLPAAEMAISSVRRVRHWSRDQTQPCGQLEQGEIADIGGQLRVILGVAEHEVLDDEFHVDNAPRVVLQIEQTA